MILVYGDEGILVVYFQGGLDDLVSCKLRRVREGVLGL